MLCEELSEDLVQISSECDCDLAVSLFGSTNQDILILASLCKMSESCIGKANHRNRVMVVHVINESAYVALGARSGWLSSNPHHLHDDHFKLHNLALRVNDDSP